MKRRLVYFVVGVLAGMVGGYFYLTHRSASSPTVAPAITPLPAAAKPLPEVAIQEGKTIDFSSGKPEIRDDPADRAALEKAKAEMNEATQDVVFAPTKTPEAAPAAPAAPAAEAERSTPNAQR